MPFDPSLLRKAGRGLGWEPLTGQELSTQNMQSNLVRTQLARTPSRFNEIPVDERNYLAQGQNLIGQANTLMAKIGRARLQNTLAEANSQIQAANRSSNQAWNRAQNAYSNSQGQYKASNSPMFDSFKNPSPEFMALSRAISGQESGGNYGVVNPDSGALGRYQVMPSNIAGPGGWDVEQLGRNISTQRYLNSPRLQNKIALGTLQDYYRQYKDPRMAAAAWYAGPGNAENWQDTGSQGAYPSINQYVQSVMGKYRSNLQQILANPTKRSQGMRQMSGLRSLIDPLKGKGSWDMSSEQDYGSRSIGQGWHTGIDLAASQGTPIYAAQSGRITKADYDSGYGNQVFIRGAHGSKTTYSHMLDYAPGLRSKVGQYVKKGQLIGYVGDTGSYSQGPHLHFETYKRGQERNPMRFFRRSGVV